MLYDKDIREPLFDFLEDFYGKMRVLEEKTMGRSRADAVLVFPESLAGLEIKSDADTYSRLARQVKDYNQYFDYNIIVVGTRHALHVGEHIPDWWGIITVEQVEGIVDLYFYRKSGPNPKVNWKKKMSLLWKRELANIQAKNGLPKYRKKSKSFVVDALLEKVPPETLRVQISEELFERDYSAFIEED